MAYSEFVRTRPDAHQTTECTSFVGPVVSRCLHDIIIEQCRCTPSSIAVQAWDGQLTYQELNELSLRLACHLSRLGVGPEDFVLSCFEKSMWAVVARLSILRAGGAYASVDATDPPPYLRSLITQANIKVIITESRFAHRFRGLVPHITEISRTSLNMLDAVTLSTNSLSVEPNNACVLLFTSGSTGNPKGIIKSHEAYATATFNYAKALGLDATARMYQFDDYTFGVSNIEFLVPLAIGGCICVPVPGESIGNLIDQVAALEANVTFLTPSVASKVNASDLPSLKYICLGGEPLTAEVLAIWDVPGVTTCNVYGMGEVAIACAINTSPKSNDPRNIGRALCGTLWIVDPLDPTNLLPQGTVGEIMVEGRHLARGYLHREFGSPAKFLEHPPPWLSHRSPRRMHTDFYVSGDLGRQNRDGSITHMGRKDDCLKMNGNLINPHEVEHQATKCLNSRDTVIIDVLNDTLVAFLFLHHLAEDSPVNDQELYISDALANSISKKKAMAVVAAIEASLPHYMVPARLLLMSRVPKTPSKKIHRQNVRVAGHVFLESYKSC